MHVVLALRHRKGCAAASNLASVVHDSIAVYSSRVGHVELLNQETVKHLADWRRRRTSFVKARFELSKESDDVYQMLCVGLGGEIAFVDRICIVLQLLPCLESKRRNQAVISFTRSRTVVL